MELIKLAFLLVIFITLLLLYILHLILKNEEQSRGPEFQLDQNSGYKRLKWFQKENKRRFRNTIYFFLRSSDRRGDIMNLSLSIPKTFNESIEQKRISLCKVRIGGFQNRTKCLEDIPADIEVNRDGQINIYPLSPIPKSKDNFAVVIKTINPRRGGLYQFHASGQFKGESVSSYLGSWTIVID